LRSSAIISVGTALSRATGLLRTIAIAYALTTVLADSYNLANTAPNVVYDLILGGVLAATLVPVLVTVTDKGDSQGVKAVATVITVVLVVLTAVAMLAAPAIVRLYTFPLDPATRAVQESAAIPLLRMFLPQVLFYGLTALFSALLNARRRFAAAAFAPALNNVLVIGVLVAVSRLAGGEPTVEGVLSDPALLWLLGLGTTAGIAAMAIVLIPAMRLADVPFGFTTQWRHPAVKKIVTLSGWTLGYVVVNQIGLMVLLALANGSAPDGSLSAYSYAYLFFQLPYGLFAVAVMTAFLPELSSAADRGDRATFVNRFGIGLRLIMFVLLPSTVLYVALSGSLVQVLFNRGNFTAVSADLTTEALVWFGVALPGFAVFMYARRGFYARKDTRTPFFLTVAKIAVMVAAAWPLSAAFGLSGVVIAFGGAFTLSGVVALVVLGRKVGGLADPGTGTAVVKSAVAAAAMLAVIAAVPRGMVGTGMGADLADLLVLGTLGAIVYLVVLAVTRSPDLLWVLNRVKQRGQST
jgi:putative peptidoglycan lipid II flippase